MAREAGMDAQEHLGMAEALGFSEDELAMNRAGRLSDSQRARMGRSRSRGRTGTVVLGLIVVAFIAVIAVAVVPHLSTGKSSGSSATVPAVIGALALIAVVMAFSLLRARRSLDRLVPDHVERTEGVTTTREHRLRGNVGDLSSGFQGYGGGIRYEVTIGGTRFFVKGRTVLEAFQDGRSYRGYYVGRGVMAMLLSAEPSPATGTSRPASGSASREGGLSDGDANARRTGPRDLRGRVRSVGSGRRPLGAEPG
jgi:hypothetical protein